MLRMLSTVRRDSIDVKVCAKWEEQYSALSQNPIRALSTLDGLIKDFRYIQYHPNHGIQTLSGIRRKSSTKHQPAILKRDRS